MRRLRKSDHPQDRLARNPKRLDEILSEARRRGYATRDPSFTGATYRDFAWGDPYDDGLAAIALPLLDGQRVHGSINILWIKTAYTIEDFAPRHLGDLQAAAREIVASLHAAARTRSHR